MSPSKAPPDICSACSDTIGPIKEPGKDYLDFLSCVFCRKLTHSAQSCSGIAKSNLSAFRFTYCRFACLECRGLKTATATSPREREKSSAGGGPIQAGEPAPDLALLAQTVVGLSKKVEDLASSLASASTRASASPSQLPPQPTYAAIASETSPSNFAAAVAAALKAKEGEEKRNRTAVFDMLSPDPDRPDQALVQDLLDWLELPSPVRILSSQRLGQATEERPQKLMVELQSAAQLQTLCSSATRQKLRASDCPAPFCSSYVNPSRTWEERRLLTKLRQRCKELNSGLGGASSDAAWFLDYRRSRLVKKEKGSPLWNGPSDSGWDEWSAKWEKANPPRRGAGLGRHGGSDRPSPPQPPSSSNGPSNSLPTLGSSPSQARSGNSPARLH